MALTGLTFNTPLTTQRSRSSLDFLPIQTGGVTGGKIKRGQTDVATWSYSGSLNVSYRQGDSFQQPIHQGTNTFTIGQGSFWRTYTITRKTYTGIATLKVNRVLKVADEHELLGTRNKLSVARQLLATLPVTEQPQRLSAGRGGQDLRVYLSPETLKFDEDHHLVDTDHDYNNQIAQILPNGAKFFDIRTATPIMYISDGFQWIPQGIQDPVDVIGGPRLVTDQTTGRIYKLDTNPYNFVTCVQTPNTAPVWITGNNLGTWTATQPLSIQLVANDPDDGPLTFNLTNSLTSPASASTPIPGVTLSSSGLLSGTPQDVNPGFTQTYSFPITVTDGTDRTTQTFTVEVPSAVVANSPPVWVTSQNLGAYSIGQSVSIQVQATDVDGDGLTYGFINGIMPAGLTFTSATRTISGTISASNTAPLNYGFAIVVADGNGHQVIRNFYMDVNPAVNQNPTWNTQSNLGTYHRLDSVSIPLSANDPEGQNVTYAFTGGVMPGGLSLNTSNWSISGTISGAASIQTYNFTITATDAQGGQTSRTFSMNVQVAASTSDANGCLFVPGTVTVTGSLSGGTVWGDNSYGYTNDSDISRAAVHAGLIGVGTTATITLNYAGYKSNFPSSFSNGVASQTWATGWCAITLSL